MSTTAAGLVISGARAYPEQYPTPLGQAIAHADHRLYEIEEQEKVLADQKAAYIAVKAALLPLVCSMCRGRGRVQRPRDDGDGTMSCDCTRCKGKGVEK